MALHYLNTPTTHTKIHHLHRSRRASERRHSYGRKDDREPDQTGVEHGVLEERPFEEDGEAGEQKEGQVEAHEGSSEVVGGRLYEDVDEGRSVQWDGGVLGYDGSHVVVGVVGGVAGEEEAEEEEDVQPELKHLGLTS